MLEEVVELMLLAYLAGKVKKADLLLFIDARVRRKSGQGRCSQRHLGMVGLCLLGALLLGDHLHKQRRRDDRSAKFVQLGRWGRERPNVRCR